MPAEMPLWVTIGTTLLGSGFLGTTVIWGGRRATAAVQRARAKLGRLDKMMETVATVAADVAWMTKELRPNGGSSLRDSITRTERMLAYERTARRVTVTGAALYERDAHGRPTYVSPSFTALTGLTSEDFRDGGWSRVVAPRDRARALHAFTQANEDGKFYADEFIIVHATTRNSVAVRVEETPVFFEGRLIGWLGRWLPQTAT